MFNMIEIEEMEYKYETIYYLDRSERIKTHIQTIFRLGDILGKIKIPVDKVKDMHEDRVKEYIFNHLNSKLERKFIDEI